VCQRYGVLPSELLLRPSGLTAIDVAVALAGMEHDRKQAERAMREARSKMPAIARPPVRRIR